MLASHHTDSESRLTATLDAAGRFQTVSRSMAALLDRSASSLIGSSSPFRIPVGPPEVWSSTILQLGGTYHPVVYSLRCDRRGGDQWTVTATPTPNPAREELAMREFSTRAHRTSTSPELDAVVRELSYSASTAMGITTGIIVLIDTDTSEPVFAGGLQAQRHQLSAMEESRARGAPMTIWHAFHDKRIVIEREWRKLVFTDDRMSALRPFVSHSALDTYAGIPLRVEGEVIGVFAGLVSEPDRIDAETVVRWDRVAHEMGMALHAADSARRARAKSADRERLRLNEDLHAKVSQDLFALRLMAAEVTVRGADRFDDDAGAGMDELRSLIDDAVDDVRGLITQRSQEVEGTPLSERLRMIATRTFRSHDIAVEVTSSPVYDDLSLDFSDDVIRIVHEALRNVLKHASASRVSVDLSTDEANDDLLLISIRDDGVPFGSSTRTGGFGLTGIEKLAAERKGTVEIVDRPSKALLVRMSCEFESEWSFVTRGYAIHVTPPTL